MLVSDFMVNYMLKILKGILWNAWNVLTMMYRKNVTLLYIKDEDHQIATSAKLLGTMYKSNGFRDDLIEKIY